MTNNELSNSSTLTLIWHEPSALTDRPLKLEGDGHPLAPGLWLIRSDLSRSKHYHRMKCQLPVGTAVVCAPLGDEPDGWPKFKGMEPGALAWLKRG